MCFKVDACTQLHAALGAAAKNSTKTVSLLAFIRANWYLWSNITRVLSGHAAQCAEGKPWAAVPPPTLKRMEITL